MSESAQQLIATALELTPDDRVVVANAILASLKDSGGHSVSAEVHDAWSDEIRDRIADIDSGRAIT
jgi:hemoglobin-like flavoprotein